MNSHSQTRTSLGTVAVLGVGLIGGSLLRALRRVAYPPHGFGMPRHLRISIGLEQEHQRCIQTLQQALETA